MVRRPVIKTSKSNDERYTTSETMKQIGDIVGIDVFDLDPCSSQESTRGIVGFLKSFDGLIRPWHGNVYVNPPFSNIEAWVIKAWDEMVEGKARSITMLLPANRTEQPWWQVNIEPWRDAKSKTPKEYFGIKLETHFLPGRTKFGSPGETEGLLTKHKSPPFACCLLHWSRNA